MDPKALLDRFLGPDAAAGAGSMATRARDALGGQSGALLGGAAAGGLLGLLLGNKKVRRMAGGAVNSTTPVFTVGAQMGAASLASRAGDNRKSQPPSRLRRLGRCGVRVRFQLSGLEVALIVFVPAQPFPGEFGRDEAFDVFVALG